MLGAILFILGTIKRPEATVDDFGLIFLSKADTVFVYTFFTATCNHCAQLIGLDIECAAKPGDCCLD